MRILGTRLKKAVWEDGCNLLRCPSLQTTSNAAWRTCVFSMFSNDHLIHCLWSQLENKHLRQEYGVTEFGSSDALLSQLLEIEVLLPLVGTWDSWRQWQPSRCCWTLTSEPLVFWVQIWYPNGLNSWAKEHRKFGRSYKIHLSKHGKLLWQGQHIDGEPLRGAACPKKWWPFRSRSETSKGTLLGFPFEKAKWVWVKTQVQSLSFLWYHILPFCEESDLRFLNLKGIGFAANSLHPTRRRWVLCDFAMDLTGSLDRLDPVVRDKWCGLVQVGSMFLSLKVGAKMC